MWSIQSILFSLCTCISEAICYAATAERACGIKEIKTECGLMQNNLEPYWWETKSHEANWLLNRFPVRSQSVSMPVDGDVVRPLEFFTRGRTSRRMIDRQLTYFVSAGTPCLVHDIHMKGSTIAPKARWMVAIRMFNEQLILWCPRTNAETKTKSFTAFKLRSGIYTGLRLLVLICQRLLVNLGL